MEQNLYWDRQELPTEITGRIDRILEEMRMEGISVLTMPEQLLVLLLVKAVSGYEPDVWEGNFFLYDMEGMQQEFHVIKQNAGKVSVISQILEESTLAPSRQVLSSLCDLAQRLLERYPGLGEELVSAYQVGTCFDTLSGVMDYLTEAIHRSGKENIFFTPRNIAVLMAGLVDPADGRIWEPAFGSGNLLVQAAWQAERNRGKYELTGNEINAQLMRFARINVFFHGISQEKVELRNMNTIEEDFISGIPETYDYILANPPVSAFSDAKREEAGFLVATKKLHLQFLQVILERLKQNGRAAVLVNESFLFGENTAERAIRQAMVEQFGLRAVISLPQGVFAPYTNAKSSLLFLDKSYGMEQPVSFYELKALGYTLDKKGRPIPENDIPKVLKAEADREKRYYEWVMRSERESQYNEYGIRVPLDWKYEMGWFAEREVIRREDYNLIGSIYCRQERKVQKPEESPAELLQKLEKMERESEALLEEILRMVEA